MEIITEVEKCCLTLEREGKITEAQVLRHEATAILKVPRKPKSNLTNRQRKGLAYLKSRKDLAITPFDKGQGFASIEREKLVEKAEKEYQNVSLDTPDTTGTLERKIQAKLRKLKSEGKLDNATYKEVYPSGSLTPSANPAIKAHKPAKDFPARLITSHIDAPQEALSSLLNKILQPFVEKSKHVCKNSFQFVEAIKNLKLGPLDKMVSFDAAALFPSIPIEDCIKHICDLLTQDTTLQQRTQLTPTDITDLIRICLSSSDFVYNDRHHTTKDSGPIGLSLMVLVAQIWMTHTMDSAIAIARQRLNAIPRHIFIYMDDIWCVIKTPPTPRRQGLRSENQPRSNPADDFRECLNAVHPRVQFTMEEEEEKSIAFLDVHITRQNDGSLTTKIYRKPSNTNIGIKPQSCQDPKVVTASFKGELCRCYRLCSSIEQTKKEIQFTLNLYEDNGNNREKLQKIADEYEPPQNQTKSREKKDQNNKNRTKERNKHQK